MDQSDWRNNRKRNLSGDYVFEFRHGDLLLFVTWGNETVSLPAPKTLTHAHACDTLVVGGYGMPPDYVFEIDWS